jgi:Aspartyl protease/PDZ domain
MVSWSYGRVCHSHSARGTAILAVLAGLASSFVAVARAEITPEAKGVVEHYLEATGGRAQFESIHSVHGKGTVQAFGFSGEIETWTRVPGQRATRMEIGPLKLLQGNDGEKAWRTDPGGKVIVLDGQDLQRSIASTWFDANRWLLDDQGGGSVSLASGVPDAAGYDVLEVKAPDGDMRQMWVSKKTGLIDKVVTKTDQRTVVNTLSDYRAFGGELFAMTAKTSIEGMPANDVTVTFQSFDVNTDFSDEPFRVPGEKGPGVHYLKQDGVAHFAFQYSGRHLWVRASVNGNPPADFIFDTGASITVIDSAYAAQIGLETQGQMQGQGAGAVGSVTLAKLNQLRVDGIDGDGVELTDQNVAVLSISPALEPFFWKPCAGILGFNFISQFVNEIDYDTGRLVLYDPATFQYSGKGEAIPIQLAGTVPTIRMTIDGKYEGEFRVDVGSSSTVDLHRPFVEKNGIDKVVKKSVDVTSGGFGGTFTSRITRMQSIAIGPFGWKDPVVSLSQAASGALASTEYAGNVGNRILERFKCTFDYERRKLYLEPGARYRTPDTFTRAGLQIARSDDKLVAMQVIEGSPAAKAGITAGDEIRAIDGTPADQLVRDEIDRLFEEGAPGRKVALDIVHDGTPRSVKMKLKDFI